MEICAALGSGEVRRIRNINCRARWFQERMIQALMLQPKNGRHPQDNQHLGEGNIFKLPHLTQRVTRAKVLKHEVIRRGRMQECLSCGQFWLCTAPSVFFSEGICPGAEFYGRPEKDRPWIIPSQRGPIWWGIHELHKSHKAA